MKARKALLHKLLRTLVEAWGHSEVEAALAQVSEPARGASAGFLSSDRPDELKKRRGKTKLLATEQVARAQLSEGQRRVALTELAVRFDRKQFLPTVSDVREFLIMMGETPGGMKDRSDAFRRLLTALSGLPLEQLEHLVSSALHSGPSQLGPLSDAISAAAETLPRHRDPSAS